MRLVAENGDQLGIKTTVEALRLAEEQNVDLVEIAPLANPPVCKLMDYGKFRYREQKKAHEAKLKQKQIQVKEIKFRPGTDEGDYKIKLGKLIQFLDEGDKAKVTLRFRGREMAHKEFGERLLERVRKDLDAVGRSRAVSQARGPADGDGAGAEEERPAAAKGEGGEAEDGQAGEAGKAEGAGEGCSKARLSVGGLHKVMAVAVEASPHRRGPPGVIRKERDVCPR